MAPGYQLFFEFVAGIFVLLVSARLLVSVTSKIVLRWALSPLFVSFIIALSTTLPEASVTFFSLLNHDTGLALGNLIGSNISNATLIFGSAALFGSVRIGTVKSQKNALLLALLTFSFISFKVFQVQSRTIGLLLLGLLMAIVVLQFWMAEEGREHEDKSLLAKLKKQTQRRQLKTAGLALLGTVLLAATGLLAGGHLIVRSVEEFSLLTGLSTTALGMTLVAITTSFPELMTTVVAGLSKKDKLVFGTVINSNLYNLGLYVALLSLSQSEYFLSFRDLGYLGLATGLFIFLLFRFRGKVVPKRYALILLALFGFFLVHSLV